MCSSLLLKNSKGKVYKSTCALTIAMNLLSVEKDHGTSVILVRSSQVFQSPDKSVYEREFHQ
jgi:hypothetical protein